MRPLLNLLWGLGVLAAAVCPAYPQKSKPASEGPITLVITFKDGHQQTFSMSNVARVEYLGATEAYLSPQYFLGQWEFGDGSGGTFRITLESSGEASRTLGASHGIWTVEGNEARINWDDGWHDALRKIGEAHEKLAYAPGTTFSDQPENVTNARKLSSCQLPGCKK